MSPGTDVGWRGRFKKFLDARRADRRTVKKLSNLRLSASGAMISQLAKTLAQPHTTTVASLNKRLRFGLTSRCTTTPAGS